MDYKKLSLGLGVLSLAIGAAELFASRRIARALDADGHEGLIRGFGVRELATGAALVAAPGHSTNVWNRVLGDAMDLTALGFARKTRAVWGAIAFTVAATTLDIVTARGLDRETGKVLPVREHATT